MSATFLTTLSITLIEIIIILLILLIALFLRFRKLKSASSATNKQGQSNVENTEKIVPFLTHLKDEINRTTDKLEEVDGENEQTYKTALSTRLELLRKEKQIIESIQTNTDNTDYRELINRAYASDHHATENDAAEPVDHEAIYLARIKNLESFKDLFLQTHAKLKESFDTIDALKHKISEMPSSEENTQLEEMIDKLSIDNIGLNKKLDLANKSLKTVLDEATPQDDDKASAITDDTVELLRQTQEENDLLKSQIHQLQNQEHENTTSVQEKITLMETDLRFKEAELEALKNSDTPSSDKADDNELSAKLVSIEEENEFLMSQIQHLLQQELEATHTMQEQISTMETNLRFKEVEIEALKNSDTPSSDKADDNELSTKLASIEEENEFLMSQIQHLLHQELEATQTMQEQISTMETNLRFKEAEIEALKNNTHSSDKEDDNELLAKLASVEDENEFLLAQIQHLLQQEMESTRKMQDKIDAMEVKSNNKKTE